MTKDNAEKSGNYTACRNGLPVIAANYQRRFTIFFTFSYSCIASAKGAPRQPPLTRTPRHRLQGAAAIRHVDGRQRNPDDCGKPPNVCSIPEAA
jgi:hypothetical protein